MNVGEVISNARLAFRVALLRHVTILDIYELLKYHVTRHLTSNNGENTNALLHLSVPTQ